MYRLPKEVFETLLNNSIDSFTGERVIGYLCGKDQEVCEGMEYILELFPAGAQWPAPEYWLYKMEELFAGDENEVVFQSEGSIEEIERTQTPEERGVETIVVESLPELLAVEPGLSKYLNKKNYGLFRRPIQ